MQTSEHAIVNGLARVTNFLFLTAGQQVLYRRYSQIIYEGDKLEVFGLFNYCQASDQWMLTKPLCFAKGESIKDYISSLTWNQVSLGFGCFFRGALFFILATFAVWGIKRLLQRMRRTISRLLRERFRQEDAAQQIPDAPPFQREGVDRVDIESYSCTACQREARSVIFTPCRDCYLCKECYTKLEDKNTCGRCQQPIESLIQIYASNQQHP